MGGWFNTAEPLRYMQNAYRDGVGRPVGAEAGLVQGIADAANTMTGQFRYADQLAGSKDLFNWQKERAGVADAQWAEELAQKKAVLDWHLLNAGRGGNEREESGGAAENPVQTPLAGYNTSSRLPKEGQTVTGRMKTAPAARNVFAPRPTAGDNTLLSAAGGEAYRLIRGGYRLGAPVVTENGIYVYAANPATGDEKVVILGGKNTKGGG